ncbi:MAG: histone deacetylase family protein [Burkholderiales bacterium]|jgi:acetoin utilization deacetylase AcuC-like enzyme/GNAT superfamily N-acetyltransferase
MFRIRQVHNAHSPRDQIALAAVLGIYETAFPYAPQYSATIAEILKFASKTDFDVVLLVAEGDKDRILGFSLSFFFPRLRYAYLDYIATDPKRPTRGYGVALYERNREVLREMGCRGLFMDVPPDDVDKLREPGRLRTNQRRMEFYERMGAFPVVGTQYESVTHKANQGYVTYLVFENYDPAKPLTASALKKCIARILLIKGKMPATDAPVKTILESVRDNPVKLREPRYRSREVSLPRKAGALAPLDLVVTDDTHQIHHLAEKGYVERPARVRFILKGLEGLAPIRHKVRHFGEKHITEVHRHALFEFLKKAATELAPGELVYPNVFPIRRPDRIPKTWEMKAGYYCIDTFTPVTANAYKAARHAVDATLTGAERLLKGSRHTYVLCRPPGHHAESRVFGGFCYFNNAAIAAHHLSRHGRVAFIDIDHHHGNGSQEIFYQRNDVYFVSIHGHPRTAYPYFAGYSDERGEGPGKGYNRNFPLYPGTDDDTYLKTLAEALNVLKRFKPDYLVISLGLDIMSGDPTGAFKVSTKGMQRIGALFSAFNVPVLVVQEGGYTLRNLRLGAAAFFTGLLG